MNNNAEKKQNDRRVGTAYEEKACVFLKEQGLQILERNFRVRQGEIDIVAREGNTLVFAEVKYRKNPSSGLPEEAVTARKQKQISRVALFYLSFRHLPLTTSCRFDVVAICGETIRWYRNAFPYAMA